MKKLLFILFLVVLITTACSSKPPSVRVTNQRSTKANVQFKLSDANTININDVNGGATTSYQDIVEGGVTTTAVIQSESVSPSTTFTAEKDKNYTVVVTSDNPPALRINSEDK